MSESQTKAPPRKGRFQTILPWVFPVLLVLTLWGGSAWRATPQIPGPGFVGIDKVAHFLIYGLIATALVRVRYKNPPRGWPWLVIFAVSMAGLTEELIQATNPFRSFEWEDWYADTAGAAVAVACYYFVPLYRRVLEWPNSSSK